MNRFRTNRLLLVPAFWLCVVACGYVAGRYEAKAAAPPDCAYNCVCENVKAYKIANNIGIIHYESLADGSRVYKTNKIGNIGTTNVCDDTTVTNINETIHETTSSQLTPLCTNLGKMEASLPVVVLFPPFDDNGFGRQVCAPPPND